MNRGALNFGSLTGHFEDADQERGGHGLQAQAEQRAGENPLTREGHFAGLQPVDTTGTPRMTASAIKETPIVRPRSTEKNDASHSTRGLRKTGSERWA